MTFEPITLKISDIRRDCGTQTRMKLSERTVQEYMEEMKTEKFPPIVVVQTDDGYILADGFHRCEAAERLHGRDADINTLCKPGTKRDALLYALGANNKHGLRRTNEDKRHTVLLALQDEKLKQESNRSLARICGVSEFLVRSIREPAIKSHPLATASNFRYSLGQRPSPPPAQREPGAPPPAAPPAEGEAYAPAQQPATYIKSVGWNWRRANDEFIARSPTGAEIRQSSLPDLAVRVNEFICRGSKTPVSPPADSAQALPPAAPPAPPAQSEPAAETEGPNIYRTSIGGQIVASGNVFASNPHRACEIIENAVRQALAQFFQSYEGITYSMNIFTRIAEVEKDEEQAA